MDESVIERLYEDLLARSRKLDASSVPGHDLVELERENRACVEKLRHLSASIRGEDRAVQGRWLPKLRPIQDQLRESEKKIEVLRNREISRRTVGGSGTGAGAASAGMASAASSGSRGFGRPSATGAAVGGMGGGMGGADTLEAEVVQERATVSIARDMLRTVNETSEMGATALTELERQGQQLDRAHDNVRRLNEHMDKAEEHITGMKSIFGGLINKLRGKTKAIKLDTDVDFPVDWERKKKWEQKTIRFGTEDFARIGSSGVARASIKYTDLNGILVTSENTFEISYGRTGREALRTAQYKQVIALLVRKCNKPIRVIFDESVQAFDPRTIPVPGYTVAGSFGRRGDAAAAAAFESQMATADDDAIEDAILQQVSFGVGDIKAQALAMNQELGRQSHKIDMLEVDVDISNSRVRRANRDIRELM